MKHPRPLALVLSLALCAWASRGQEASGAETPSGDRFRTDRSPARTLALPDEEGEVFQFVVYGDRTGGPAEGIRVLEQAVADTNLLGPDLVLTVGDLVEGYGAPPLWLDQMREFQGVMDGLSCPWFPVAGNHDVYWRGEGQPPPGENEAVYEEHFGPLWYAFSHRGSWFVVLYTDEGDPETGAKSFTDPRAQRMSERQLAFLDSVLEAAKGAPHVFLFMHHPRWTGGDYGDDWTRVHRRLVAAGNVTAVFGGHIHRMRYDPADGIEYFSLATTGGWISGRSEEAGFLHEYHVVTVRPDGIDVTTYPVGSAMDPRSLDGGVGEAAVALERSLPELEGHVSLAADGSAAGTLRGRYANPAERAVELRLSAISADPHWSVSVAPESVHLGPGQAFELELALERAPAPVTVLAPVELVLEPVLSLEAGPVNVASVLLELPLDLSDAALVAAGGGPRILLLDGVDDVARVEAGDLDLPDGPFTLEGWFRPAALAARQGLLSRLESSEYGILLVDGGPELHVHLDGDYVTARAPAGTLTAGRWSHVAGVFDGAELRLYVDGGLVAAQPGSGTRTRNDLPFLIGADVGGGGSANSFFSGAVDAVRVSRGARYRGESFTPTRALEADESTGLLLAFDERLGAWAWDGSGRGRHARLVGGAELVPLED